SVLYEEEALVMLVAIESLSRFIRDHLRQLHEDILPTLSRRYRISLPQSEESTKSLAVTVSTMPQLAAELEEMAGFDVDDQEIENADSPSFQALQDDLIPEDSFLSLGVVSWEMLEYLPKGASNHQAGEIKQVGDGLPV
ncbi:MAG: DUF6930 domain-containing protein, partial [Nostoc sp.]